MKKININGSVILVTGGTGSWGHELVKQLTEKYNPKEIRIYSRGEHKQVEMKMEFNNPKLRFIIGDVRDKNILNHAMKGVDIVFHLAALKHVPVCEENSWEAVLTNIYGTQNVIECAVTNNVKKVVDVSTDKAVEPFNLYGVAKACGEKLIINANAYYSGGKTTFMCIRGGNVLGTAGSVIPLFRNQILENNEITITNPKMTRFLMSTREAIGLVFIALEKSLGGEVFVMNMPGTTLENMANVMVELFGDANTKKTIIGSRAGEKIDEFLVSKNEAPFAYKCSNQFYVILPQYKSEKLVKHYSSRYKKLKLDALHSRNTHQLNKQQLKKMLLAEKWLVGTKKTRISTSYNNLIHYNLDSRTNFSKKQKFTMDVEKNIDSSLEFAKLLSKNKIIGEFYISGEMVEKHPSKIKQIAKLGHIIGGHGYHHEDFAKLNYRQAHTIIKRTIKIFADSGIKMVGWRFPGFSFRNNHLKILVKYGLFDSSIRTTQLKKWGKLIFFRNWLRNAKRGIIFWPDFFPKGLVEKTWSHADLNEKQLEDIKNKSGRLVIHCYNK